MAAQDSCFPALVSVMYRSSAQLGSPIGAPLGAIKGASLSALVVKTQSQTRK